MRPEWIERSTDPALIALRNDDAAGLLVLLKSQRIAANARFHAGQSPLHVAAQLGAIKCAQILLDAGAALELHDDAGQSPFLEAVTYGHTASAKLFIERGAKLTYVFTPPNTPEIAMRLKARLAEQFEEVQPQIEERFRKIFDEVSPEIDRQIEETAKAEVVGELIANYSPNEMAEKISKISLQPQVMHAIHNCQDLPTLKLLIDFGHSPVNVISAEGEWPLKSFAREGNAPAIAYLLERGADPNLTSTGGTALHDAVLGGDAECVRLLLAAGAHPNQQDVDGLVPLCHVTCAASLDLLLKVGGNPNIRDQAGFLPSQWIKDSELKRRVKSVERHASPGP